MDKKGLAVNALIIAIISIAVVVIVWQIVPYIGQFASFFGLNLTRTDKVEGIAYLRYDLIKQEVRYYDGTRWNSFEGDIDLGKKKINYDQVKDDFEKHLRNDFFLDVFKARVRFAAEDENLGNSPKGIFLLMTILLKSDVKLGLWHFFGTGTKYRVFYRYIEDKFEWGIGNINSLSPFGWFRLVDIPDNCKEDLGEVVGINLVKIDFNGMELNEVDVICYKLGEVDDCIRNAGNSCEKEVYKLPFVDRNGVALSKEQINSLGGKYIYYSITPPQNHELNDKVYYLTGDNKLYDSSGKEADISGFYGDLVKNSFAKVAGEWRDIVTKQPFLINYKLGDKTDIVSVCPELKDSRYLVVFLDKPVRDKEECSWKGKD